MLFYPKCIALSNFAASFEVPIYTDDGLPVGTANIIINKYGSSSSNVQSPTQIPKNLVEEIVQLYKENIPVLFENKV